MRPGGSPQQLRPTGRHGAAQHGGRIVPAWGSPAAWATARSCTTRRAAGVITRVGGGGDGGMRAAGGQRYARAQEEGQGCSSWRASRPAAAGHDIPWDATQWGEPTTLNDATSKGRLRFPAAAYSWASRAPELIATSAAPCLP